MNWNEPNVCSLFFIYFFLVSELYFTLDIANIPCRKVMESIIGKEGEIFKKIFLKRVFYIQFMYLQV